MLFLLTVFVEPQYNVMNQTYSQFGITVDVGGTNKAIPKV